MADTGAPWNIPYVEPSDLVRNYPAANELMADAIAAGLTAAGSPGIGSNVVQAVKLDQFTMSSSTYTTVTGLSATITPSSNTSKVLIIAQVAHGLNNADGYGAFTVTRGATEIYLGNVDSTKTRSVFGGNFNQDASAVMLSGSMVFLDSPATSAATTYNVQVRRRGGDGAVFINRTSAASAIVGASSITVIEVAA